MEGARRAGEAVEACRQLGVEVGAHDGHYVSFGACVPGYLVDLFSVAALCTL